MVSQSAVSRSAALLLLRLRCLVPRAFGRVPRPRLSSLASRICRPCPGRVCGATVHDTWPPPPPPRYPLSELLLRALLHRGAHSWTGC